MANGERGNAAIGVDENKRSSQSYAEQKVEAYILQNGTKIRFLLVTSAIVIVLGTTLLSAMIITREYTALCFVVNIAMVGGGLITGIGIMISDIWSDIKKFTRQGKNV